MESQHGRDEICVSLCRVFSGLGCCCWTRDYRLGNVKLFNSLVFRVFCYRLKYGSCFYTRDKLVHITGCFGVQKTRFIMICKNEKFCQLNLTTQYFYFILFTF